MGRKEKRLSTFLSKPSDYTFDDLISFLEGLDFTLDNKGGSSGSRVRFFRARDGAIIDLHKPHNPKFLKRYQFDEIIEKLTEYGDI